MANYYTDIPELKFHLNNPMMKRICELKERNYRDKDEFDYAPLDFEDAVDSYDKVLEITGEITGEIIAANAEGVDEEGPHCANGRVEYASGTKQNLDAMVKAGLNGMTRTNSTFQDIVGTVRTIFDIPLVLVAEIEPYTLAPVDLDIRVG